MPAPEAGPLSGSRELARFGRDPLRFVDGLRGDERDLVPFRLGRLDCRLVAAPRLVREVLDSEEWPPLSRGRLMALDHWYGGGLILTEGAEHHRQRDDLWRPLLAATRARGQEIAARRAGELAETWTPGTPVEIYGAMRKLQLEIGWETLTGNDLDDELREAQDRGTGSAQWLLGPYGDKLWGAPLPASVRARAARRKLDAALLALIAERRASRGDDGLSDLVQNEEDDGLVAATVKQWLGADQSHCWLTWTLYLLATNPDVQSRWRESFDEALSRQILKESLRLYPPIWSFFRELTAEYRLGGELLPAGTLLGLCQWYTHRDPRHWPDPDRFDPGRWNGAEPEPGSYFPFSAGPYGCPAPVHATTVATQVLTTLGRRWAFAPADDRPPRPLATGVIVPKGGVRLIPQPS